jgi:hypothetical protein
MMRTSRQTVMFKRPFCVSGMSGEQPAGSYAVDTDEELIEGLSFPAYRRIATTIFLPTRPGASSGEALRIDPGDLAAALERDAGRT